MTETILKKAFAKRNAGDRLIRVLAANPKGSGFHASTFPESEIQSVDDLGEDRSALVLRSGTQIPVALSYECLEQKVYSPNFRTDDGLVLDLRDVTGPEANINTPQTSTAIAAAQEALEIGQKLKDGTVVIAVDLKKNLALFAPEGIFGGDSTFGSQNTIVTKVNHQNLHGHKDWRRITDREACALAKDWEKVAPPLMLGRASPWFWGESYFGDDLGRIYRAGEADGRSNFRFHSGPVPVVRSGPARS